MFSLLFHLLELQYSSMQLNIYPLKVTIYQVLFLFKRYLCSV